MVGLHALFSVVAVCFGDLRGVFASYLGTSLEVLIDHVLVHGMARPGVFARYESLGRICLSSLTSGFIHAEVAKILPPEAMQLMFLGGVSYTAGVPFFVRDNST